MKAILVALIFMTALRTEAQETSSVAPLPGPSLISELPLPSKEKRTEFSLSTGLLGRSMEDLYVNSKYAGGTIALSGAHRISKELSARMEVGFILSAGSYSNLYGSEGSAPNIVYIDEAAVSYRPLKNLLFEAGVILTQFSTMPSNLESLGFPSLRQAYDFGNEDTKAQIFAQQSIPTSDTAAVQATQAGITTTFLAYGAGFSTNLQKENGFGFSGSASRFEFNNLNASAATDSQLLGNSVDSAGGPQARFRYGFAGTELGAGASYRFSQGTELSLNGAFLRNELAPEGKDRGYLYTVGFAQPLGVSEVSASIGYFYNEEDTLPASYTSSGKGSNNRFGQVARLGYTNSKENVTGFVQYTRANEIVNKPYTADRDIVVLGLEVSYDVL